MSIALALALWYGPGFVAAASMTHRGHHPGPWVFSAALVGALTVPAAVVSRRLVRRRSGRAAAGRSPGAPGAPGGSRGVLVLLDADDAPDVVLAELLLTSASVDVADVVAVVHEESVATGAGRAERAIALALASCAAALSSPIRARAGVVDTTGLARSGGAEVDRRLTIASHRALARPLRGSTATQAGSLSRRVGTCVVIPAPAHDRSAAMPAGVATTSVPAASAA